MQRVSVDTALGAVVGQVDGPVRVFRGIPYALPMTGLERFRPPIPIAPWSSPYEALAFGPACPQEPIPLLAVGAQGDACLHLNVWTPAETGAPRPVMVWLHGGGFVNGASSQPLYDGAALAAEQGVVLVSVNYRLGVFGFGCFAGGEALGLSTNNGLRDQILALQWVRNHIAAFGGDPGRVTVFGESAGGMSVACLLASPLAQGLFHRAIIQSGSPDHILRRAEAERVGQALLARIGLPLVETLTLPSAALVEAQRACLRETVQRSLHRPALTQFGMTLMPVVGDDVLPLPPLVALAAGHAAELPVIIGTTRDEWNLFYQSPQMLGARRRDMGQMTEERLAHLFERALPERGAAMLAAYRRRMPEASADELVCAMETDRMFCQPSIRLAEVQANHAPVWMYRLDWPCPHNRRLGACHVMDIPFVFGIVDAPAGQIFTGGGESAQALSRRLRAAWTGLAAEGSPGADWPGYDTAQRRTRIWAAEDLIEADPERERRLTWAGIF